MYLLVLVANGLRLSRVVGFQFRNVGVQVAHLFVQLRDMDVFGIEFSAQLLQLLVFFVQLFHQSVNRFLQFCTLKRTFLQLCAQFFQQCTVFFHALCDELDVFFNLLRLVGPFAVFCDIDMVFGLINLSESVLDFVHGGHHVVQLIVSLLDNLLQRVVKLRFSIGFTLFAGCQRQYCETRDNKFLHNFSPFDFLSFLLLVPAKTITISPRGGVCSKCFATS